MKALLFLLTNVLLLSCEAKFDPKFRMEKVNFVWSKAVHHIKDQNVITKLQKDLANFDILYLTVKQDGEHHKQAKNLAEIDRKLETMLKRYDLEETIHAFKMKYKKDEGKVEIKQESSDNKLDTQFSDKRVVALWDSIKDSTDILNEELEALHRQLIQQDNRCHDYAELLAHHKQTSDNHVHSHDEHEDTSVRVKELNQEIEDTFERLRTRIDEIQENPFKNSKVRQLWDKARQSKRLIPNELDVIKSELKHLDRHWDKMNYHNEHLTEHEHNLKSMGHDGADEDSLKMREYQDKLQRKLKKLEAYLEDKVTSHSEL
ncbi:hypothetical protein M3Y97_00024500 [Aphelenchoides bicaudatus]|nr:hypothetical protein M3Y97_00024500 [Aphelenchoides bicaudatus]